MACGNMTIDGAPLMMIGMGVVWLLTIAVLVLGIAALIRYLRSDRRPPA